MEELSGGFPGWDEGCQGTPTSGPSLTSPTALERMWTIFSCGVATTLCPLISMMRCPTRTPPLSAIPPRMRLQICQSQRPNLVRGQVTHPRGHCLLGNPLGQETVFSTIFHPQCFHLGEAAMVRLWTFTSLFLQASGLWTPRRPSHVHVVCTGNTAHHWISRPCEFRLLFIPAQLWLKRAVWACQSCQCFQTISLCHAGQYYLRLKH